MPFIACFAFASLAIVPPLLVPVQAIGVQRRLRLAAQFAPPFCLHYSLEARAVPPKTAVTFLLFAAETVVCRSCDRNPSTARHQCRGGNTSRTQRQKSREQSTRNTLSRLLARSLSSSSTTAGLSLPSPRQHGSCARSPFTRKPNRSLYPCR